MDERGDEGVVGAVQAPVEAGPPPADWPRVLVIGPGTGPALYLGHEDTAAAVGYLNAGVRVRLESAPLNGRVEVLVGGALPTKGWVPVERVAAYAQARGRIEGTRAYVGPNDLVGLVASEGANMRVAATPWLGGANFLPPFVGTFPRAQLGERPVEGAEGVSDGQCYQLPAGRTVDVFEGMRAEQPLAQLPALDPPLRVIVLREREGWFGIRAGFGPYLTGYVQGPLTACGGPMPTPAPMIPPATERPYWMGLEEGALHRVAAGTRVRFHGRTIARVRDAGWARELGRQGGDQVDVFVAVGNDVAIRGLVSADALTLVEGAPTAPPEAPEDLPDELQ